MAIHAHYHQRRLLGGKRMGSDVAKIQSGEWVPIARRSPIHIQFIWTPWGTLACAMTRAPRPEAALGSRLLERNGRVHYKFLILCLMVRGVRHERLGRKIQSDHAKSIAVQSDGRAMP